MRICIFLLVLAIAVLTGCPVYAEENAVSKVHETKGVDVNNDGKHDVTYHMDDKNVYKTEADTNFDGKQDVTVYAEDGKFKSAEVDTDYDGKSDKKIDDPDEFNKWINENHPTFNDSLVMPDWSRGGFKF
jgi:hypothetical protein